MITDLVAEEHEGEKWGDDGDDGDDDGNNDADHSVTLRARRSKVLEPPCLRATLQSMRGASGAEAVQPRKDHTE